MALLLLLPAAIGTAAAVRRPSPHGTPGGKSLCLDCHDPHSAGFSRLLRFPAGDEACWACHGKDPALPFQRGQYEVSPHFRGFGGQPLPAAPAPLTPAQAEEQAEEDGAFPGYAAGPNTSTCTRCHQPHGRVAPGPKLLRAGSATPGPEGGINAACGSCHPARVPERAGRRSFAGLAVYREVRHADPRRGAVWPGATAAPGQCTACHDPHGTPDPWLLRARSGTVCYPCHPKPDSPENLWTGEKTFRRSAHAEVCLECHNPHGAVNPQTGAVYPKALVAGGADLCFKCHPQVGERFAESRRVTVASGLRSRHPVDQPGSTIRCVSCHNPHQVRAKSSGTYAAALTDPDTGKLFAWLGGSASQEFCLKCHDGSWPGAANIAAEMAKPTTLVSGFVWSGKGINLHNLHLTRYHKQKCSGCHDPHATAVLEGINRGHLLTGLVVTAYQGGYPGYEACATNCHHVRCASCHPAPPQWIRDR
ncbi:MAG: cytochrome c3 family protein [Bacillota bacterium]|nr:cytochrome c3 family protein [Bacillota bacterium]